MFSKKNSRSLKIPHPPHNVSNGPLLWPVKRATCTDSVAKHRATLYLLQQLICCETSLMVGGKTHRSSTPLAKKAAWFLLPVLPYLNAKRVTKTCNLFAALQRNEFKNYSAGFTTYVQTCLAKNQVVASCVNIDFWLGRITRGHAIHTGFRHLLQNKFVVKSRTSLCFFFSQLQQP